MSGMILKIFTEKTKKEADSIGLKIYANNPKVVTRLTTSRPVIDIRKLNVDGKDIKIVEGFCTLGCNANRDGNCYGEIMISQAGKAHNAFFKLPDIWKSTRISIHTMLRLYEAVVLSTLVYTKRNCGLCPSKLKAA